MQKKYNALIENRIWKLVDRPTNQYVLTAKWAFKQKRDIDGNIKWYKAQQIAKGFEQYERIDYFEIFTIVVKPQTNKILFGITTKKKLHFYQIDIITVFLNSCLGKKVYIEQPLYFDNGNKDSVLLLL